MNKFIGIGRWSKDIEMRYTSNGKAVASTTIAINEKYGDNDSTTFLPVVIWGKTAENVAKYSGKGRLVAIEGRVTVRSYDSNNGKKYVTEIVADNVKFLDHADNGQAERSKADVYAPPKKPFDPFADDGKPVDIDPDSLPF